MPKAGRSQASDAPWLELTWTGLIPAATPWRMRSSGEIPPGDWPGWTWLGCGERGRGLPQFGPCYAAIALVALECLPLDEGPGFATAILEGGTSPVPALIAADRLEELGNRERADWFRSLARTRCVHCGWIRQDTWEGPPIPEFPGLQHDWSAIAQVTPQHAVTMLSWCTCNLPVPPPGPPNWDWEEIGLRWPAPPRKVASA